MSGIFSPERFIDGGKKHLVIFYEESDYARKVIYQFIKNGLVKEESCIYATEEDPEIIERGMSEFGIDVERYKKKGLLNIFLMEPFRNFKNPLEEGKKRIQRILSNSQPPYRVFARFVPEINTKKGIKAELECEKNFHSDFDSFEGTFMCSYPIKKIEETRRHEWMHELIENHHTVILAPSSGNGFAYDR